MLILRYVISRFLTFDEAIKIGERKYCVSRETTVKRGRRLTI